MSKILSYNKHRDKDIVVKSYSLKEYQDTIFDKETHLVKDDTIRQRIKYSDNGVGTYTQENNFHFIVLYKGDKTIGICKIGYYYLSIPPELKDTDKEHKYMSISFCSIDKKYQGRGYLKFIIEELMKLCLEKEFILGSSSWTVPGMLKLRPTIKKYAKKYGVKFYDHEEKHDAEWMYNKKLVHMQDMTEEEKEAWKKGDKYGE